MSALVHDPKFELAYGLSAREAVECIESGIPDTLVVAYREVEARQEESSRRNVLRRNDIETLGTELRDGMAEAIKKSELVREASDTQIDAFVEAHAHQLAAAIINRAPSASALERWGSVGHSNERSREPGYSEQLQQFTESLSEVDQRVLDRIGSAFGQTRVRDPLVNAHIVDREGVIELLIQDRIWGVTSGKEKLIEAVAIAG